MQPYPPPYPPPLPTPPRATSVAPSTLSACASEMWLGVLVALLLALAVMLIALWAWRDNQIARVSVSFAPTRNRLIALIQFLIALPGIALSAVMLYVNTDALKALARYCIEYPRQVWTVIVVSLIEAIRVIRRRSSGEK